MNHFFWKLPNLMRETITKCYCNNPSLWIHVAFRVHFVSHSEMKWQSQWPGVSHSVLFSGLREPLNEKSSSAKLWWSGLTVTEKERTSALRSFMFAKLVCRASVAPICFPLKCWFNRYHCSDLVPEMSFLLSYQSFCVWVKSTGCNSDKYLALIHKKCAPAVERHRIGWEHAFFKPAVY